MISCRSGLQRPCSFEICNAILLLVLKIRFFLHIRGIIIIPVPKSHHRSIFRSKIVVESPANLRILNRRELKINRKIIINYNSCFPKLRTNFSKAVTSAFIDLLTFSHSELFCFLLSIPAAFTSGTPIKPYRCTSLRLENYIITPKTQKTYSF